MTVCGEMERRGRFSKIVEALHDDHTALKVLNNIDRPLAQVVRKAISANPGLNLKKTIDANPGLALITFRTTGPRTMAIEIGRHYCIWSIHIFISTIFKISHYYNHHHHHHHHQVSQLLGTILLRATLIK